MSGSPKTAPRPAPLLEIAIAPRRFGQAEVLAYAEATGDFNPIHVDPDFAAQSRFGGPIVHGTLVLAPVWEAMGAAFGMPALTDAQADLRFSAPVPVGATVTYHCTASDGPGLFDLRVTLVDGPDVIGGQIRVEGLT